MSSTGRGKPRSPRDSYATPEACIAPLVEELRPYYRYGAPYSLLDPGAGDGRIGRMLAEGLGQPPMLHVEAEIDPVLSSALIASRPPCGRHQVVAGDFLDWEPGAERFELVAANPPFSRAVEFVQHALAVRADDGLVIALVNMNFLGSRKRAAFFRAHPPSFMRVLTPRPSFTGGGNDSVDCAWVGWSGPGGPQLDPFGWYDCSPDSSAHR